jgi:hypothetical protein
MLVFLSVVFLSLIAMLAVYVKVDGTHASTSQENNNAKNMDLAINQLTLYVQDLRDLVQLTTTAANQQSNKKTDSSKELKEARGALARLSQSIQDSLYNGSQPALQTLQYNLENGPPYDLGTFSSTMAYLAEKAETDSADLSKSAGILVTDPAYGTIKKSLSKRAFFFKTLTKFSGVASPEQADKMKKVVNSWVQLNEELEASVQQLNSYIVDQ